jgi:hypothetical protein
MDQQTERTDTRFVTRGIGREIFAVPVGSARGISGPWKRSHVPEATAFPGEFGHAATS